MIKKHMEDKKNLIIYRYIIDNIFILSFFALYSFFLAYFYSGRLEEIANLEPEKLATFLSGILSPVVLYILIFQLLTQQTEQLRNKKKELKLEEEKYLKSQPIFELVSSTITHINDDEHGDFTVLEIDIINHGAKAFKAHTSIISDEEVKIFRQNKFYSIDSFEKGSITLSIETIASDSYLLHLHYLDFLLQPQLIEVELVRPLGEIPDCIEEQFRREASMRHDIKEINRSFSI